MENFKKFKAGNQLFGFSGAFVIMLLFTCVLFLLSINRLNTSTSVVSANLLPSIITAEELNTKTSDFRIAEASHVISQELETMTEHEQTLKNITLEIEIMFNEYEMKLITNEIDEELLKEAKNLWTEYLVIHEEMIYHSKSNDTTSAMHIMENESEVVFKEVSNVFLELVNFNKNQVDQTSQEGDDLYITAVCIIIVILISSFIAFRKFKNLTIDIENTQVKLSDAHEEALLSSQAKSNFLANMSHEIRTPMNAISGMTDIILRETTDREVTEYAQNIKRACDSLLTIINDVLDISKIESGKIEVIEANYSLSSVLNDVLAIATNRIDLKKIMFVTKFQHDLPDKLIGDEVRIKQIMVNILNNAIKFTHSGHICFDVSGHFTDGLIAMKISVQDTGIGISKEDLDKLFIEFERVDTTKNRSIEGTGLGLAISKRLSEMMGGSIEVESEYGEGTTFCVTIKQKYEEYVPIAKVEHQKSVLIFESRELYLKSISQALRELSVQHVTNCLLQSELNEALNEKEYDFIFTSSIHLYKVQEILLKKNMNTKIILLADYLDIKAKYDYATILLPTNTISIANALNGKTSSSGNEQEIINFVAPDCKVLIVDDNLVNLKVAQGLMKPYKFETVIAKNGEEAVEKIKNEKFDIVFMDHMMPIMDGIDATIAIRALEDEYYKNLPIIALTANAIIGTKEMFLKEGMNDFIAKPIKLASLNDVLLKWIPKEKQKIIEIVENEKIIEQSEAETKFSIPNVDIELGITRTGGKFEGYINILQVYYKDGMKSIALIRDYYDAKDLQNYKIEVHALKSASASIGAIYISQNAKMLEEACIKENWVYLNQETSEFIDDFNILLENMRVALQTVTCEEDDSDKESGDNQLYIDNLLKLKEAFENFDIMLCDELLNQLLEFNWDEENKESIIKIKEFISQYEYDNAIEFIGKIIENTQK